MSALWLICVSSCRLSCVRSLHHRPVFQKHSKFAFKADQAFTLGSKSTRTREAVSNPLGFLGYAGIHCTVVQSSPVFGKSFQCSYILILVWWPWAELSPQASQYTTPATQSKTSTLPISLTNSSSKSQRYSTASTANHFPTDFSMPSQAQLRLLQICTWEVPHVESMVPRIYLDYLITIPIS